MRAVITHDQAAECYRVTAPQGYRLGPDLHELVCYYESWVPGSRLEAYRRALKDRRAYPAIPCSKPNCEWCSE